MNNNKLFIRFVIVLLILALGLFVFRLEFILGNVENTDVYKDYNSKDGKTSDKYSSVSNTNNEKYLFIYNPGEEISVKIKENLSIVFSSIKKKVDYKVNTDNNFSFKGYKCVIIDFQYLYKFKFFNELFQYVKNGGTVIFAVTPETYNGLEGISREVGIYEYREITNIKGIKLTNDLIFKGNGVSNPNAEISSIQAQVDKNCIIHAVSENNRPIIWEKPLGNGKILFTNGDLFQYKKYRGLFVGLLSKIKSGFIYPIMNMKLNFIDDFPCPIPEGYNKKIYSEYGRNTSDFYTEIWWPTMLKSAKNYDAKYSTYYIESYNDLVNGNFDKARSKENRDILFKLGYEVIKNGGEIGLHGYNHEPLFSNEKIKDVESEYKIWPSQEKMVQALEEVSNYLKSVFPNYKFRSYVPPSNIIDKKGKEALKKVFPDIKVIASVLEGDSDKDDVHCVQEFSRDSGGVLSIPRFSSGYGYTEEKKFDIYNGIMAYGVFSHFVHPDDVLDTERSEGMNWEKMSTEYNKMMKDVYTNFDWLNSMTISNGGIELSKYLDSDIAFEYNDNSINGYCKNFKGTMYYILRSDKKITKTNNCDFKEIDNKFYLIKVKDCEFKLEME
ncbi:DUF2194 domain-containing protein [Clostridium sporogenes]|uniref:DUF2194 domain-containing protein n=1 Tax=Clostridium sporogenes TaxID=1509 RepID=UPI001C102499|nr:DUF2194 domain-containing protein [Clostridium sporogenes]MBU5298472.1 DUF2194 domain-containing protein [Clostridium sporogenes]